MANVKPQENLLEIIQRLISEGESQDAKSQNQNHPDLFRGPGDSDEKSGMTMKPAGTS